MPTSLTGVQCVGVFGTARELDGNGGFYQCIAIGVVRGGPDFGRGGMSDTGVKVPEIGDEDQPQSVGGINSFKFKMENCEPAGVEDRDISIFFEKLSDGGIAITVQETKRAGRQYRSTGVLSAERFKLAVDTLEEA